ncbi:hypothetical protein HMPREF9373_0512 [Psychrobacter sp. 1501(2011)]|nr:hypothetical protein HMPREF9373_0512 [Psychrobacter sp. 1501(2011)]
MFAEQSYNIELIILTYCLLAYRFHLLPEGFVQKVLVKTKGRLYERVA